MKKLLSREDVEMYDTKVREFADAFFSHVNSDKHSKEKDTSSETKKRRRSTDQDEVEEENMEPSGERSVKAKVIMECRNSENLDEFIQELKETYLEIEMSKTDAEEELVETKKNFLRIMEKYNKDPRRARPKLTECERASLAHVDPDVNILGSLMQPTDGPPVNYLKTHEFTSSLTINMLTMNHGNLTRNPKLDGREVYNMAMKDRPIVRMMMQNSEHILCLNEADAFLSPQDEKSRELIKTFIRSGTRASLSSHGHPDQLHALSAADLPQEWNYWQDTFPQRVRIGEPHSGCSDVSSEPRKFALILNTTFRPRTVWQLRDHPCLLSLRSASDRDCQHEPLSKDTDVPKRLSFSTSSRVMSIVVCSQNHPTNHSSSLTAAT